MSPADISTTLEQQFGDKIKSTKLDAIDPYVVVEPADLVEVCRFLRDDPRLKFEILNNISGVDYLEPDPKKAPKAGFEPHVTFETDDYRIVRDVSPKLLRHKDPKLHHPVGGL